MTISQWMYNGFAVPFFSQTNPYLKHLGGSWWASIGFCVFFRFFFLKFIETFLNVPMYPSFSADAIPIFKDFLKSYHPWRFAGSTIGHRQAPERQVRQVPFHWGMFQTRPSQWWEGRGIISTNDQRISMMKGWWMIILSASQMDMSPNWNLVELSLFQAWYMVYAYGSTCPPWTTDWNVYV